MGFSRKAWIVGIAVVVVAAIIAGVIVWRAQPSQPAAPTQAALRATVLQVAKLTIPTVTKSTVILAKQLPIFMRLLVLPDATEIVAQAVLYTGGLRGYEVRYIDSEPAVNSYTVFGSLIRGGGGWSAVHSIWASGFAYVEFSGNGMNGRAEFTSLAPSSTSITIWAVQD